MSQTDAATGPNDSAMPFVNATYVVGDVGVGLSEKIVLIGVWIKILFIYICEHTCDIVMSTVRVVFL